MAKKRFKMSGAVWQLVGLGFLAIITIGVVAYVMLPAAPTAPAASYTPKPVVVPTAATLTVAPFEAAGQKLRESREPFTLTVIGDSTGFPKQGWVEMLAEDVSVASGRLVNVHTWNQDTSDYDPAHSYGSGGPELTIWNGSASGQGATYSLAHLGKLMSHKSDLVIVNHGHNVTAMQSIRTLVYAASGLAGPETAFAVTKQNPRTNGSELQEAKVKAVGDMVPELAGVALLDAHAAFPADPAPWLSADGVHPNNQGYRAWAGVVFSQLGFTG